MGEAREPTTFGRYELLELLAVGGMAEIFLGRTRLGGIAVPFVGIKLIDMIIAFLGRIF